MDADFLELYQGIILEHNRAPQNFGPLELETASAQGYNPSCGDDITIHLHLSGDKIDEISFTGEGCAISKASASLLTLAVKNKSKSQAEQIALEMLDFLTGKKAIPENPWEIGDRLALLGVRQFPMRVKCATLAWHALLEALKRATQTAE